MKKSMFDRGLKNWNRLLKQQKKAMKQIKKMRKLLAKTFNRRALTPKPIRRLGNAHKVAKSIRKNRDAYLTGVYAIARTVGNFFKVSK